MATLTGLDWPTLLDTLLTRWYLVPNDWDLVSQCAWQTDCPDPVVAYASYDVCELPGDTSPTDFLSRDELVCSHHLPDLIRYATNCPGGNPLAGGTVVEIGVDPALLRLTGVDPAVIARFNDAAMGVSQ